MLRNDGSGTDPRRHHKKTCWDGVKEDMKRFGLSRKDAQSRRKLRRKIGGGIQQTRVKPTCVFSIDNYCISSTKNARLPGAYYLWFTMVWFTSWCLLLVVYNKKNILVLMLAVFKYRSTRVELRPKILNS